MFARRTAVTTIIVIAVVLFVNLTLIDDFARLLTLDRVATASEDAATHYFRMMQARDLYLPSGHYWGWEPYWYQGYVPFLLYPHLTYDLLALLSDALPIQPFRLFNAYTLAIYLALPVVGAGLVRRRFALEPTILAVAWLASITAIGAGVHSVFGIGLLSQQVGVVLFVLLCYDCILAKRIDRGAVWLGLTPLVHVHTSLIAALVWTITGVEAAIQNGPTSRATRTWLLSSVLALLIALPTVLGLAYGWDHLGKAASWRELDSGELLGMLWRGRLCAPFAIFVALLLGALAALRYVPANQRRTTSTWLAVSGVVVAISIQKWSIGIPVIDQLMSSVLHARSLPYAYILIVFIMAAAWKAFPRSIQLCIAALTFVGICQGWSVSRAVAHRIGVAGPSGSVDATQSMTDLRRVLNWVSVDSGGAMATMSVSPAKPAGLVVYEAVKRCHLPLLTGHGAELTDVQNDAITTRAEKMPCDLVRKQLRDYAVGYLLGERQDQREALEKCFRASPSFMSGRWWVFATGIRWGNAPERATEFSHSATWTELHWTFQPADQQTTVRLPIAYTAPWVADADGTSVNVIATKDGMMEVRLPAGTHNLNLRYPGFRGEWAGALIAGSALLTATLRVRRSRSDRAHPS